MTPKEKLVTVLEGTGLEEIKTELYKHRIERCWWSTPTSTCAAS